MATFYWGGGTAGWTAANTANWYSDLARTTLAGSVPTAADDVVFDNLSSAATYTVTIGVGYTALCNNLTITAPAAGTVTFTSTSGIVNIKGNVSSASTTIWTVSGGVIFSATTTGNTVGFGHSLGASPVTFNGSGGGWTLASALITTGALSFTTGTFDTSSSSNWGISCGNFTLTGTGVRTVNLNASIITCGGVQITTLTNLTFNAGTSSITTSALSFSAFNPSTPITFYNYAFSSTTFATITLQNLTFNNLTFPAKSVIGLTPIILATNITVNGLLTCTAPTTLGSSRYFIQSSVFGTTRTLTAGAVALTDVDFQDISTGGSWTGTRLGDVQGNSGITFTTGVAKYWNLVTGGVITGTGWALSSGGTPSAANFPLAQDTMTFVDTGLNTSATVTMVTGYNIGGIDCSARTLAMTLAFSAAGNSFFGNIVLSSPITVSGSGALTFQKRASQTITSAGKTLPSINVNSLSGTVSLVDDLALTLNVNMTSGTFDANNKNILANGMVSSGTVSRTLTMGSGTWTLFGTGTNWNLTTSTGMTLNSNTSTIVLSNTTTTARTFAGGGLTYANLVIGGSTGTSTLTFTGSNTFTGTISSTKTVAHTITFTSGITTTVANWTVSGTAGNIVTIGSSSTTSHNLVKTGGGNISVDYMSISRSNASP